METTAGSRGDRLIRVTAGAVLFVPALAWWFGFDERFRTPKLLAGEGLVFAGLGIAAVLRWRGAAPARWRDWAWDPMVAGAVATLFLSPVHRLTGWLEVTRLAALAGAFSLFAGLRSPWRLAPWIIAAASLNAGLAILQSLGLGLWDTARAGRHAIYGTFGNPNFMAEYLGAALIVSLGWTAARRRAGFGRLATGMLVPLLLLAATVFAGGRAALAGAVAGYAVLAGWLIFDRRPGADPDAAGRLEHAIGVLLVAALGWTLMARAVPVTEVAGSADPTVGTRSLMARVAVHQFRERRWWGGGPGSYGARFLETAAALHREDGSRPAYAGVTAEAHNDWLQLLAERGLAGAILIVFGGWIVLRGGCRGPSGAAAAGVIAAIGVAGLFGFPLRVMPTGLLMMWALACAVNRDRPAASIPRGVEPVRAVLYLAGGLWLCLRTLTAESALGLGGERAFLAGLRALPGHGELHFRYGLGLIKAGRLDDAEREFIAAKPGFPDADVLFNLGWISLQRKDYPAALDRFGEGLRLYPFFRAPAWADDALALHGAGRDAEARAAAERALSIDPGLGRARTLLDELNRRGRRGRVR